MHFIQLVTIALIQGLTEFLPISSDAHLILIPRLMHWPDQGLMFDIAGHVGTLTAVILYFRHELVQMSGAWGRSLITRQLDRDSRLAWAVLFATIPVGIAGLLLKHFVEADLRTPLIIGIATLVWAGPLLLADWFGRRQRDEHQVNWVDVVVIGCSQALALVPGTSRSGITMTAGLTMGLTREGAARFSFLMSIPVIFLAGGLEGLDLLEAPAPAPWGELLLVAVISMVTAYAVIHYFLKFLTRTGMLPFVLYRALLGIFLLIYVFV